MKVNYQGHEERTKRASIIWRQIAKDYNSGMSVKEITQKYKNPVTKKPYTNTYVYWVLKKVQQL